MKLKFVVIFLISIIVSANAGVFDDRYPSVRATGMSNAYVAIAGDAWASYYNPAGLAQLSGYQASFSYQKPFGLSFFKNYFFAAAIPLPWEFGAASVSFESFGVEYNDNWMSQESSAKLSHGFYLLNDMHTSLALGYNLNYYYWDLGQSVDGINLGAAGTFGFDLGLMASLYKRTYLGVFVYNLNSPTLGVDTKRDLPQRIVIGAAYRPITDLVTSLSFEKAVGFETMVEGGVEYYLMEYLSIRLGASTMPNRISAGFGVHYAGFQVDYAFRNHPVLAETHQFGLSYIFNPENK